MVKSEHGDSIRVHSVPTRDLVGGIISKATLLARREIELVKAEIKADSKPCASPKPGRREVVDL
jgi:hypothetical protein